MLRDQSAEKLVQVDFNINVYTMDDYYLYGARDGIVIIDEYDAIMSSNPYSIINQSIYGVWELRDIKVIAFSATST